MDKISTIEELKTIVEKARRDGKKIVLADGAFDVFHVGHIRYLEGAKEQGDILIVALYGDEAVKSTKGLDRPIVPLEDRVKIVSAMEPVDYVTILHKPAAEKLILELRPHVVAKGSGPGKDTSPERNIVVSYGGKIAIVGGPKEHSSSAFIERISKNVETT